MFQKYLIKKLPPVTRRELVMHFVSYNYLSSAKYLMVLTIWEV